MILDVFRRVERTNPRMAVHAWVVHAWVVHVVCWPAIYVHELSHYIVGQFFRFAWNWQVDLSAPRIKGPHMRTIDGQRAFVYWHGYVMLSLKHDYQYRKRHNIARIFTLSAPVTAYVIWPCTALLLLDGVGVGALPGVLLCAVYTRLGGPSRCDVHGLLEALLDVQMNAVTTYRGPSPE